jgi:hypothetical protein
MSTSSLPFRAVVFASEQLFPALQFLLHTADRYREQLASVHIYCTPDERRSAGPARRLAQLMQRWLDQRGWQTTIELTTDEATPQAVRQGLLDWFNAAPDSQWLINVTGGTKPMSAAATELTLATDLSERRVIYQEITGSWWEMSSDEEGLLDTVALDSQRDPAVPARDTLERLLPIGDLVATQFSDDHEISAQPVQAFCVDQALAQVMARHWKWSAGLAAVNPPVASTGNGDAFERFVGAGLLDCGLKLHHSLKVTDPRNAGHVVREIDLVGCHQGRLICIDIKLPGAQEHAKGTQLADVAELAHSLGGRGALAVALRPGWKADPNTERLARALGVLLLTQADAPQLFSRLLQAIDRTLQPSAAVQAAEQMLQAKSSQGNQVLSDGNLVQASVSDNGILFVSDWAVLTARQRQEPWGLVQLSGTMYWLTIPKKQLPAATAADWPNVYSVLQQRLRELSLHHAQPNPRDTPAWANFRFILDQGVSPDAVRQLLRDTLLPAPAASQ